MISVEVPKATKNTQDENRAVAQSCVAQKIDAPVGHACPYRKLASLFSPERFCLAHLPRAWKRQSRRSGWRQAQQRCSLREKKDISDSGCWSNFHTAVLKREQSKSLPGIRLSCPRTTKFQRNADSEDTGLAVVGVIQYEREALSPELSWHIMAAVTKVMALPLRKRIGVNK